MPEVQKQLEYNLIFTKILFHLLDQLGGTKVIGLERESGRQALRVIALDLE